MQGTSTEKQPRGAGDDAYWFKPKSHGYGASPSNWKGWMATLAFVAAVFALTWSMIVEPSLSGQEPTLAQLATWMGFVVVMIAGFIWLCRRKTDGEWRWRWGNDS